MEVEVLVTIFCGANEGVSLSMFLAESSDEETDMDEVSLIRGMTARRGYVRKLAAA